MRFPYRRAKIPDHLHPAPFRISPRLPHRAGISILFLISFVISCHQTSYPGISPLTYPENLYTYSLNLYQNQQYREAINILKDLISEYPEHPQSQSAHLLIGLSWIKSSRPEKAKPHLRLAIQSEANLTDLALFLLARAQIDTGELAAADSNLQALGNLFPWSPYLEKALFQRARLQAQMRNYPQAQQLAEQVLEQFPQSPDRVDHLDFHARIAGENLDHAAASRSLWEIWSQHPLNPLVETVESRLKEIPASGWPPDFNQRYRQALLIYLTGEFNLAEEKFLGLLEDISPPEDNQNIITSVTYRMGLIKFRRRQYGSAQAWLDKLLQAPGLSPELEAEALLCLGKSYSRNRQTKQAQETYRELMNKFPSGEAADEALYLLGRLAAEEPDPESALDIYRRHLGKFPRSKFRNQVLWYLGWQNYLESNFAVAVEYFNQIQEDGLDLINFIRPRFWQARALTLAGKSDQGDSILQNLAQEYPLTYYGYLSALLLQSQDHITVSKIQGYRPFSSPDPTYSDPLTITSPSEIPPPDARFHLQRASELIDLGLYPEADLEFSYLLDGLSALTPDIFLPLGSELIRMNNFYRLLSLVESHFFAQLWGQPDSRNRTTWEFAYPRGWRRLLEFSCPRYHLDPNLVFAVVREESRFNPRAQSFAGARGLMQIIPSTGRDIARRNGKKKFHPDDLFDPETNLGFGSYYLSRLLHQFEGKLPFALAGYNAGPHNIRKWLAEKPELDQFEFIDDIPYPETRRYVKKVIQSYLRYSRLYPPTEYSIPGQAGQPGQFLASALKRNSSSHPD